MRFIMEFHLGRNICRPLIDAVRTRVNLKLSCASASNCNNSGDFYCRSIASGHFTVDDLPSRRPVKGGSLSGGHFVLLGALAAILILTVVWAISVWTSSNVRGAIPPRT